MNKISENKNIPNNQPKCNCQTSNYKRKLFESQIKDIKLNWSQFIRGKPVLSWHRSTRLLFSLLNISKNVVFALVLLLSSYLMSFYLVRLFEVDVRDDTYKYYFSSLTQVYGTLLAGILIFIVFRYDNTKKALKESKQALINYIRKLENQYNIHRYPELNVDENYQRNNLINNSNFDDQQLSTIILFWFTILYRHRWNKNYRDDAETYNIIKKRFANLPSIKEKIPWAGGGGIPPNFSEGSGFDVTTGRINEQKEDLCIYQSNYDQSLSRSKSWSITIIPIAVNLSICLVFFVIFLILCVFLNQACILSFMIYSTILVSVSLFQLFVSIDKIINEHLFQEHRGIYGKIVYKYSSYGSFLKRRD